LSKGGHLAKKGGQHFLGIFGKKTGPFVGYPTKTSALFRIWWAKIVGGHFSGLNLKEYANCKCPPKQVLGEP
jgi:hypothetical protein